MALPTRRKVLAVLGTMVGILIVFLMLDFLMNSRTIGMTDSQKSAYKHLMTQVIQQADHLNKLKYYQQVNMDLLVEGHDRANPDSWLRNCLLDNVPRIAREYDELLKDGYGQALVVAVVPSKVVPLSYQVSKLQFTDGYAKGTVEDCLNGYDFNDGTHLWTDGRAPAYRPYLMVISFLGGNAPIKGSTPCGLGARCMTVEELTAVLTQFPALLENAANTGLAAYGSYDLKSNGEMVPYTFEHIGHNDDSRYVFNAKQPGDTTVKEWYAPVCLKRYF